MTIADLFRLLHGTKPDSAPPSTRRFGSRTEAFSALEADFFASAADLYPDAVSEADAWEMRVEAAKARN